MFINPEKDLKTMRKVFLPPANLHQFCSDNKEVAE